jgi:tetratricopeptide (TPR) repeat protein
LGRYGEAVEAHRQALDLQPEFHKAWNNLGIAYSHQGKIDAARECYEKAIAIAPDYAYAYGSLGSALIKQGHPEKAIEVMKKGVKLDASIPVLYGNLALAYGMVGRYEEARKTLRQATGLGYKNWREIQRRIENLQELEGSRVTTAKRDPDSEPTPLEIEKLRIAMLPPHCPSCAALVSLSGVTWVGQLEALCPYCGVQLIRALDD